MSEDFLSPSWLTIGELARRTGAAPSALRYYESLRLITSDRTEGNQRRYARSVIRVVSLIRAAQSLGVPLESVRAALSRLPNSRAPSAEEWANMSAGWREDLDRRIQVLEGLRDNLDSCIGCGCLSLETCELLNKNDKAGGLGPGPRYLLGDKSDDVPELS